MRPPSQRHWLRENARERSPHRVLFADTETRPASPDDPDRQVLRLWAATLIRRHTVEPAKPRRETFRGTTGPQLVEMIERVARADVSTWLFFHNLNFDLAVTELPVELAAHGWRLTDGALTTDDPWFRMARGNRRLTVADSWSWLPASVATIGELVGLPKDELPADDDAERAWWDRCERDVAIVERAMLSVLDWWDAGTLGNWSLTGPATGWSSYRHRRPAPRVLVDPDERARALEMAAVTGGRREVHKLGEQPPGLYADLDLATAHLTAMASCLLPARRISAFASLDVDDRHLDSPVLDVLAECDVEVRAPRYPWDSGRGVFYPTGRFRTVLAGPELRDARARGELRSIGRGYTYLLSAHMSDWAHWVASLLAVETPDIPPAVRLLAKHWSRCVPGKWAGHTSDVVRKIDDPRPGWSIERGYLADTGQPADFLRIGGERWTVVRDLWADDAFPAILAWIQSHTRIAISRVLDELGDGVLAVNTDGCLVDVDLLMAARAPYQDEHIKGRLARLHWLDRLCSTLDPAAAPFSLRVKKAAGRATVLSPQHLVLDAERHFAGLPARAISLGGGRYTFTQWPKLRVQLVADEGPGYRTRTGRADLSHIPPTGWLLDDGRVLPVACRVDGAGVTHVVYPSVLALGGCTLAESARQHPRLRPVLARGAAGTHAPE